MEKKVIITQSMMKSYYDYHNGEECGLVFEKKYIDKRYDLFPSSDSQNVGNWLEYLMIGANTKSNGTAPQPERTKGGELTAPYKKTEGHVENFKKFMELYDIEIVSCQEKLSVGETIIQLLDGGTGEVVDFKIDGMEGTTDIICRAKNNIIGLYEYTDDFGKIEKQEQGIIINAGEEFICDIKTSGLLDDFRSPYGWGWNKLSEKEKLVRQPIHYKYLTQKLYGKQYKFVFLLFSQTNDFDYRALIFNIDEEEHIKEHEERIVWTNRWVKHNLKKGFKAYPSVTRCHTCPLKIGCKHFEAVPKIKVFDYQPQKV